MTMVCCWDQFSVRHYFSYIYINNLNEDVRGMCNNFAIGNVVDSEEVV